MTFFFQLFRRFLAKKPVLLVFSIVYIRKRLHFICGILGLWFKDTHKARKNFIVKKTGLSVFCTVYIGKPVHTPEAVPVLSRAGNNIHKILWCLVPWWCSCFSGASEVSSLVLIFINLVWCQYV